MHPFILAVKTGNVGGRSSHVKSDNRFPRFLVERRHGVSDNAARRTGKNRPASGETIRPAQAAVGLHKKQIRITTKTATKPFDIFADERRQVGVDATGLPTVHNFNAGHDPAGQGNLGETHLLRQRSYLQFMSRISECVQ